MILKLHGIVVEPDVGEPEKTPISFISNNTAAQRINVYAIAVRGSVSQYAYMRNKYLPR